MSRDLEDDMMTAEWFLDKVRTSDSYAQNIYAALCNMKWQVQEVWSCSWRSAGGIVANLRGQGEDYMDWYCSGMGGFGGYEDDEESEESVTRRGYVAEGTVTDEVCEDLFRLGWVPVSWDND